MMLDLGEDPNHVCKAFKFPSVLFVQSCCLCLFVRVFADVFESSLIESRDVLAIRIRTLVEIKRNKNMLRVYWSWYAGKRE